MSVLFFFSFFLLLPLSPAFPFRLIISCNQRQHKIVPPFPLLPSLPLPFLILPPLPDNSSATQLPHQSRTRRAAALSSAHPANASLNCNYLCSAHRTLAAVPRAPGRARKLVAELSKRGMRMALPPPSASKQLTV